MPSGSAARQRVRGLTDNGGRFRGCQVVANVRANGPGGGLTGAARDAVGDSRSVPAGDASQSAIVTPWRLASCAPPKPNGVGLGGPNVAGRGGSATAA
ncbi:MAG: hypothetical protein EHM77_07195 [Planctomycetaceae bacterium]|nr:MAG: hypothetical protein EHM77_07195 [Planctomycetaceae bacterium]